MNELYIPGDLVYYNRNIITIENSDGYYATYYDEDEFLQEINVNVIKGIPLTSEILEKNGWKLLKHHKRNSYDDVPWTSYHKPAETNISLRFYPEECVKLPKGSIEKLIRKELSWNDEPVELKEE